MCFGGGDGIPQLDPRLYTRPSLPRQANRRADDRERTQTTLADDRMIRAGMLGGTVHTTPFGVQGFGMGLV